MHDAKTQAVLDGLRTEFLESALDMIEEICEQLSGAARIDKDAVMRSAHSIKGQAGAFGFPTVTTIAHMLETIILHADSEPEAALGAAHAHAMRDILNAGVDPTPAEAADIFATLKAAASSRRQGRAALIVNPSETAAQIAAASVERLGYASLTVQCEFSGLSLAARMRPHVVIVARNLSLISVSEFLRAAGAIDALAETPFIVMAADASVQIPTDGPLRPAGVVALDRYLEDSLEAIFETLPAAA